MPPGAARNAVDCALWDLDAKLSGKRAWQLAAIETMRPLVTAYTLSLDTPEKMAQAAAAAAQRPLLKIKLGREGDDDRLHAPYAPPPPMPGLSSMPMRAGVRERSKRFSRFVRKPASSLWNSRFLPETTRCSRPLNTRYRSALTSRRTVSQASTSITGRYDAINIKLDKTGGLTEALALSAAARGRGLTIMVGCMLATSLAMAPAMVVSHNQPPSLTWTAPSSSPKTAIRELSSGAAPCWRHRLSFGGSPFHLSAGPGPSSPPSQRSAATSAARTPAAASPAMAR